MLLPIVSGTNRPGNLSIHVAKHVQALLSGGEMNPRILSLEDVPASISLADFYRGQTPDFAPFQEMIDHSDFFVFVAPEYNGSIPGVLKVFIDACRYPGSFQGKKAALVGVSAGAGGNVTGLKHLEDVLNYLGVEVLTEKVYAGKIREKLDQNGAVLEAQLRHDLEWQAQAVRNALQASSQ